MREKPDGLFISEDLSPEMSPKRESQVEALKEVKIAGTVADFVLDCLVVRDRPSSLTIYLTTRARNLH